MEFDIFQAEKAMARILGPLQTMLARANGEKVEQEAMRSIDLFLSIAWIKYHLYGGAAAKRFVGEEVEKAGKRLENAEDDLVAKDDV